MPHSVLVTRKLPASVIARLETACNVDLWTERRAIPREELLARVSGKDAVVCLLTDTIDSAVLDAAGPSLRVVANVAVGYNNIDVPACRARGVAATNTPDVLTNACADFTWALILAVTRRLGEGERVVRAGRWTGWALDYMTLRLDYGLTTSCYDPRPDGSPCGHCDSCRLRAAGFAAAGVADPAARVAEAR